jgi:hypothetical protein
MTQRYIDLAFDDTSPRSFGGFDNENEATVIRLKVLDPDAKYYIEIEQACGKHDKYCSDVLPIVDGYAAFEISRDFTHETLYVQGVMKVNGMCRKTARVRVGFSRSINALDELPESHPGWADSVDERLNELEQSSVIPDWGQNDENAQDYIKNRTHWKEEGSERYERVPLRTYYYGNAVLHYIGDRPFAAGSVSLFQEYPFAILAVPGDDYYSQIHLSSLNYRSLSLIDTDGQIVAKRDLTQAKENKNSDGKLLSYDVLLDGDDRIPLNFDMREFTVVLETKPVYHKIPQEYIDQNTYVFELKSEGDKFVSPLSSNEIIEIAKSGKQVVCYGNVPLLVPPVVEKQVIFLLWAIMVVVLKIIARLRI